MDAHTAIPHFAGIPFCINLPAIIMIAITTAILVKGTKDSAKMAGIMVAVKLGVIALFVLTGMFYIRPENWTPFAPNGFEGLFMGAFIIFFASPTKEICFYSTVTDFARFLGLSTSRPFATLT